MESNAEMNADSDDEINAESGSANASGDPQVQNVPKYNAELEGLISAAVIANVNMRYKRAVKMCLEILKINTRIPEAYELQAEAFENMPDLEESVRQAKAIEWLEMGCSVLPGNTQLSIKLAEAYWKNGKYKQADDEYTKIARKYAEKARASTVEKKRIDIGILFKRAQAREKYSSDRTKVIDAYLDVLRSLRSNEQHAEEGLALMRKLLKECHQLDDAVRGLAVTEAYYDAFPNRLDLTDIRALIELFVINEQFHKVLGVFRDRFGVQFLSDDGRIVDVLSSNEAQTTPFKCVIPRESIPTCIAALSQKDKHTPAGYSVLASEGDKTAFVTFIDLYSRLFVALIRVGRTDAYRAYDRFVLSVRPIFKFNETTLSDTYLDIVDALMSVSAFADANRLLNVLLSVEEFQLAAIYLKQGDALMQLDALVSACGAYRNVIRLSSRQVDAHLRLLRVLQRADKLNDEANANDPNEELRVTESTVGFDELKAFEIVSWINANLQGEDPNVDLREAPRSAVEALAEMLITKSEWLYIKARRELDGSEQSNVSQIVCDPQSYLARFTRLTKALFIREISERTTQESLIALMFPPSNEQRAERARQLGLLSDTRSEVQVSFTLVGAANSNQMYSLYLHTCELLYDSGQFETMRLVALHSIIVPALVRDPNRIKEVNFQLVLASLQTRRLADVRLVTNIYFRRDIHSSKLHCWLSMLAHCLPHGDASTSHRKNIYRMYVANPDEPMLVMLAAAAMYFSGFVKHALSEFTFLYKHAYLQVAENKRDPLLPLMIGLCMLSLGNQQKVKVYRNKDKLKRQTLYSLQATAFFNEYARLRGETQETFYNLGRAMHQMSLFHLAIPYYRKVLELNPVGDTEAERQMLDLKREAAFNLCVIYRASGSNELAATLTEQYLVI